MSKKGIIFDMDGVIFDTERTFLVAIQTLSSKFNLEGIEEVFYQCIGVTREETKRIFLEAYGQDFPYDRYSQDVDAQFHRIVDAGMPVKPYVREILSFLKDNGYKTAIASSTKTEIVMRELDSCDLTKYFDKIIGGDQVKKSKPDPEIFLKAAESIDEKITNCIVIEDSFNGIRAAHAAGAFALMVPDILQPDDEIKNLASAVVPSLREAQALIEKN